MIRRTMWATATVCLALGAGARAQTGSAPKAALGAPSLPCSPAGTDYIARGAAPNPGYPAFVPRAAVTPAPTTTFAAPTFTAAPALLPVAEAGQDPSKTGPAPIGDLAKPKDAKADTPKTLNPPTSGVPQPRVVDSGSSPGGFAADQVPATATPTPIASGTGACGPAAGGTFLGTFTGYTEGPLPNAWISAEWLNWQFKGVTVPPLVTVAPAGAPGTIGDPATRVVYGGPDLLTDWNSGYRIRAGLWLDGGMGGIDIGFFALNNLHENFGLASTGSPGIFRPFYNTAINAEDAQLVAFVDPVTGPVLSGRIAVLSETELSGLELNYRTGYASGWGGRFDVLCGYRYLRLRDSMTIATDLTTLVAVGGAPAGTTIRTADQFLTTNEFQGGQVGVVCEWQIGCMTFGFRGTFAAGVTVEHVGIYGATGSVTPAGATVAAPGGLYALPTNAGTFDRTRFAIAPEVGATLGYQVTENCRLFGGYNFLYWTQVSRAGEQINRQVNGTAIPDPLTGLAAPLGPPAPSRRGPRDEYFYAHGFSVGLEFRY